LVAGSLSADAAGYAFARPAIVVGAGSFDVRRS